MGVEVEPELLRWAVERAGYSEATLAGRFPKLEQWLRGEDRPTLEQLERFARATHAPVGYFFLQAPPQETVPIPGHGRAFPRRFQPGPTRCAASSTRQMRSASSSW